MKKATQKIIAKSSTFCFTHNVPQPCDHEAMKKDGRMLSTEAAKNVSEALRHPGVLLAR